MAGPYATRPDYITTDSGVTLRHSYSGVGLHESVTEFDHSANEKSPREFFPPGTGEGSDSPWGRRKLLWWKWATIAFVLVACAGGLIVGFLNQVPNLGLNDGNEVAFDPNVRTIVLSSTLISVDPIVGTMILDFQIYNDTKCFFNQNDDGTTSQVNSTCTAVDIFFDQNLLMNTDSSGPPPANDFPTAPVFHWDATAGYKRQTGEDVRPNSPVFRLNIALFGQPHSPHTLQSYPFDVYDSFIFMFAQETATNNTVTIAIGYTEGVAVGFEGALNLAASSIGSEFISETITLRRSGMIKAYTLTILIAIWAITLILLVATITPVFFGYQQRVEVLVIPVGTLFAFTQLRATLPGAPAGFGATIDFVGILPCLALMSLSGAACLFALVLSNPTENRETTTTRLIKKVSKMA